jgi:hypothetical protein
MLNTDNNLEMNEVLDNLTEKTTNENELLQLQMG